MTREGEQQEHNNFVSTQIHKLEALDFYLFAAILSVLPDAPRFDEEKTQPRSSTTSNSITTPAKGLFVFGLCG